MRWLILHTEKTLFWISARADFAGTKLYATDTERLKEVLTGDFIKNFVKFGKSGKFRV